MSNHYAQFYTPGMQKQVLYTSPSLDAGNNYLAHLQIGETIEIKNVKYRIYDKRYVIDIGAIEYGVKPM